MTLSGERAAWAGRTGRLHSGGFGGLLRRGSRHAHRQPAGGLRTAGRDRPGRGAKALLALQGHAWAGPCGCSSVSTTASTFRVFFFFFLSFRQPDSGQLTRLVFAPRGIDRGLLVLGRTPPCCHPWLGRSCRRRSQPSGPAGVAGQRPLRSACALKLMRHWCLCWAAVPAIPPRANSHDEARSACWAKAARARPDRSRWKPR